MTLNEEIAQFGALVGLLLTLATLFTGVHAATIDRLRESPTPTRARATRDAVIAAALALITALVFLAGLPLWLDTVSDLRPLAEGGALRSVFGVTWIVLLGLIAWQVSLARTAWRLRNSLAA